MHKDPHERPVIALAIIGQGDSAVTIVADAPCSFACPHCHHNIRSFPVREPKPTAPTGKDVFSAVVLVGLALVGYWMTIERLITWFNR